MKSKNLLTAGFAAMTLIGFGFNFLFYTPDQAVDQSAPDQAADQSTLPESGFLDDSVARIIIGTIGLLCSTGSIFLHKKRANLRMKYSHAAGSVIEMVKGTRRNSGKAPLVEYEVNGKKFRYRSTMYTRPSAYYVGEVVDVLYNPDKPDEAMLNGFVSQWLEVLVLGTGGILFLWLAIRIV